MTYKFTVSLGLLIALSGCATSGEVNQVESRLDAVQQQVEALDQRTYTLEHRPTRAQQRHSRRYNDRCYGTNVDC